MSNDKKSFTHLSLQDAKSIKPILDAISKGLNKGEMVFKNEQDEIVLNPDGLLRLKISASKADNRHKVNVKISWEVAEDKPDKKNSLSINSSGNREKTKT